MKVGDRVKVIKDYQSEQEGEPSPFIGQQGTLVEPRYYGWYLRLDAHTWDVFFLSEELEEL